jgi:5-methyltetrahydrofolate corrinoid/iron sulfur protein methyltransferase
MLIIGEKINSSIPFTKKAIENRDTDYIRKLASDQAAAGAHMIDVNAGTFVDEEVDIIRWLVQIVQDVTDVPLCIDSPNPAALKAALPLIRRKALVNSISLEKDRYNGILPVVKDFGTSVVALCMDDEGIPKDADKRIAIACRLAEKLNAEGIATSDIYFDVLVQPISVDDTFGMASLNAVKGIRERIPGAHTTGGVSNISFGLPERKLLNNVYTAAMISAGMDTLIIDPLDRRLMASIAAAKALTGQDEFCDEYLTAYRSGRLKMTT